MRTSAGPRRRLRRRAETVLALAIVFAFCVSALGKQLETDHFTIFYSQGYDVPLADGHAQLVGSSLETAYETLVIDAGLPIYPGTIEVDIVDFFGWEMGAEYRAYDGDDQPYPVIEIGSAGSMEAAAIDLYLDTTIPELVAITTAHELFHVIQDYADLRGIGDFSEDAFVESHAVAAEELVFPDVDDYLEYALYLLVAPDSKAFLSWTYEAGIFWVHVADRYGGLAVLRDVMAASASFEGRYAIDQAFEPRNVAFDDLWTSFAIAYGIAHLRDQETIDRLLDAVRDEAHWYRFDLPQIDLPILSHETDWSGERTTIDRVNVENPYAAYLETLTVDPVGSPLRVAHSYGIDVVEIRPFVGGSMTLTFRGDSATSFRAIVAIDRAGEWETAALTSDIAMNVPLDPIPDRVRIIVTRGEAGAGAFAIDVAPGD